MENGWIQVPQGSDISLSTGNLIVLDSTQLPGFLTSDETAVITSNPANPAVPTDLYFGLQMRVRQHGSSSSSPAGTCSVVAIDNNTYNNIICHPDWFKVVENGEYGVAMYGGYSGAAGRRLRRYQ